MKRLLRVSDVASLFGVSSWTFRRWLREVRGPAFKRSPGGRGYLFREEDVRRWLDSLEGPAVIEAAEPKESSAAVA